jgi:hypothetical protein
MPRDVNKNKTASQPTRTELSVHMIYLTAGRTNKPVLPTVFGLG